MEDDDRLKEEELTIGCIVRDLSRSTVGTM